MTHQRTETRPGQRHGEGCHGNGAEIKDFRIDVEWRESLNETKKNRFLNTYLNRAAGFSPRSHHHVNTDVADSPAPLLTPEVMTTDWNLWKTGLMAIEGSIQLRETDHSVFHLGDPWAVMFRGREGGKCGPPEVQHRVGNGGSSVFKRLNDDCETFKQKESKAWVRFKKIGHFNQKTSHKVAD